MHKLLSIDGGGVRGLIVLHCLVQWENTYGIRVPDVFNCYSGTSIGAIIVALFAYLGWSANDVLDYFVREGILHKFLPQSIWDKIFGIFQFQPKYNDSQRFEVLNTLFEDRLISDSINSKMVLITGYDLVREQSIYFTNKDNIKLVDALLVSSSAPLYFSSVRIKRSDIELHQRVNHINDNELWGVDGGLTCNNPSDIATLEILKESPTDLSVVSIGTGFVQPNIDATRSKGWGLFDWLLTGRLLQKIIYGNISISDKRCRSILDLYRSLNRGQCLYLRVNGVIDSNNSTIDNTKSWNLQQLAKYGQSWAIEHGTEFELILRGAGRQAGGQAVTLNPLTVDKGDKLPPKPPRGRQEDKQVDKMST